MNRATCAECFGETAEVTGREFSICDECRDEMLQEFFDEHNIVVVDE